MLTTGELSKLFKVTTSTIVNWIEKGRIDCEVVNVSHRRIPEIEVLKYIQRNQICNLTLDDEIYSKLLSNLDKIEEIHKEETKKVEDNLNAVIKSNSNLAEEMGLIEKEKVALKKTLGCFKKDK